MYLSPFIKEASLSTIASIIESKSSSQCGGKLALECLSPGNAITTQTLHLKLIQHQGRGGENIVRVRPLGYWLQDKNFMKKNIMLRGW